MLTMPSFKKSVMVEQFQGNYLLNFKILKFHVIIWQSTSNNCTKVRAAPEARLFFIRNDYSNDSGNTTDE